MVHIQLVTFAGVLWLCLFLAWEEEIRLLTSSTVLENP